MTWLYPEFTLWELERRAPCERQFAAQRHPEDPIDVIVGFGVVENPYYGLTIRWPQSPAYPRSWFLEPWMDRANPHLVLARAIREADQQACAPTTPPPVRKPLFESLAFFARVMRLMEAM